MKVYNETTDKIEVLPTTLVIDGITTYTSKMTDEELIKEGYFKIEYTSRYDEKYYNNIETRTLTDTKYIISYTKEEKDVEIVKVRIIGDLVEKSKKEFDKLTADYSSGEMSSWFELVTQCKICVDTGEVGQIIEIETGITGATPLEFSEKVLEKAKNLEIAKAHISGIRSLETGKVEAFTTIQECIDYEYVEPVEPIDPII